MVLGQKVYTLSTAVAMLKKYFLVALAAASLVSTQASNELSCSVVDYLYYKNECCDTSNTVSCLKSIPTASKIAIDALAAIKNKDGTTACADGDLIKYFDDADEATALDQPGLACVA
jgi:hypothetical protein